MDDTRCEARRDREQQCLYFAVVQKVDSKNVVRQISSFLTHAIQAVDISFADFNKAASMREKSRSSRNHAW